MTSNTTNPTDIIDATEQAEQSDRHAMLSEYRRLLLEGTAAEAQKLRDLAERLGRADRLREDQHIVQQVAEADVLKADRERLATEAEVAQREYKKACEAEEAAEKRFDQARTARWEAGRQADRIARRQTELQKTESDRERLRQHHAELFGDPAPEPADENEMVEVDGMMVSRRHLQEMRR